MAIHHHVEDQVSGLIEARSESQARSVVVDCGVSAAASDTDRGRHRS